MCTLERVDQLGVDLGIEKKASDQSTLCCLCICLAIAELGQRLL